MKQLIECVPNYSEGKDQSVIQAIVEAISTVEGVKVLDVDPGEATNRTVVTFVGEPGPVCEAAFRGAARAQELIDMRKHHGAHPRSGATDVLPLIPIAGITLEECAQLARKLAERMFRELGIPCYCYEAAAFKPERKNLAVCREGEYEALPEKMADEARKPDFGGEWNEVAARCGASNVGARGFLVAVNFNLNTTSTRRAMAVAFDVREKGRKNPSGEGWIPGTLKGTKAIGWFIDEYGIAQVSMNITDIDVTPLHVAFEEVSRAAAARGLRVTGAEIVGLVPKRVLLEAGRFYLEKQQRSLGISEEEIVKIAVKSMSLDDLKPFNPKEKVIEYLMAENRKGLTQMTVEGFTRETASESAAPGGGSVSACMGAFAAALSTMVANLSAHKRGWDARWKEFSDVAEQGHCDAEGNGRGKSRPFEGHRRGHALCGGGPAPDDGGHPEGPAAGAADGAVRQSRLGLGCRGSRPGRRCRYPGRLPQRPHQRRLPQRPGSGPAAAGKGRCHRGRSPGAGKAGAGSRECPYRPLVKL